MHSSCEGETNVWNFDISRMFYLSENVTENFFNHQQWWKEMKKQMIPSKNISAKSKAGTNYTKTYKLNSQFIKSHQRQSRNWNWHWNQLSDLVIFAISIVDIAGKSDLLFQIFLSFFRFSFLTGQKKKQKLLTPGCSGPRRQKHEINEEGFKAKIYSH